MKLLLVSAVLCLALGFAAAQETGPARILASKTVLNQYLVQKKDLIVQYALHNVGESAAYDVHLDEQNFNKADFEFVSGFAQAHWDRIPANSNVTHTLILQPKDYRFFNFTAARVQYRAAEPQDAPIAVGWTSAPGEGQIWETNHFNRQFAPHYADWITFLIMTIPTVGIPYLLWYRSKGRYEVTKHNSAKKQ
jgi:translocon-associated protein subunit beta